MSRRAIHPGMRWLTLLGLVAALALVVGTAGAVVTLLSGPLTTASLAALAVAVAFVVAASAAGALAARRLSSAYW